MSQLTEHSTARTKILALENEIAKLPSVECPLTHYFADGVYVRQIFMPAGTFITGRIHLHEHVNIVSMGKITCYTEEGRKEIKGPDTFITPPGTKRALYIHEDTIWTTIHKLRGESDRDITDIEKDYVVETYSEFDMKFLENIS
jgi:quercetin dioxygenase-like cupin family protein